jgi:hypothetical protein
MPQAHREPRGFTRPHVAGLVALATLGLVAPTVASAAGPVPAACVVVNGPSGLTVQVGYAPSGPADCQTLP